MRKNLSQNASRRDFSTGDHQCRSRRWFAALLWLAFPGASERDVARRASGVLEVSERQVINWLRCENDAALRYVTAVMVLAGVLCALEPIRGRGE
ncbi:hypothetical protein PSAL_005780 [Pseudooceanicola algae]|uniref:Uncharacterized protein n=2 Tax=Pseudooceanicola algae TaxID=1537215 RepID=A0A418SDD7_9RHOB|nr:hypothetical protein PSAL_005780 [Pseudooceanicola algae]